MENVTLRAHFDGSTIQLDEPYDLAPDTKLLVTVIPPEDTAGWTEFSRRGLASAYGDADPEYALNTVREPNPDYERG